MGVTIAMSAPHADPSTLAQLAEGTLPEEEARALRAHLAECRSCLAAYADAVRYRAAWLANPDGFDLDDSDLEMVRSLEPDARSVRRRRTPRGSHSALAGALAVLAVVLTWQGTRRESSQLHVALDPATLEATARASARGLVLPGAEPFANATPLERRAGPWGGSIDLDREIRTAVDRYERSPGDAEVAAQLLASLLANGEVESANEYAREALRAHPRAVPLLVFAAEARVRRGDLTGAEELLRRGADRAPHDPLLALDLGLVLRRLGRESDARVALQRAARASTAPIAARAKRELEATSP